MKTFLAVVATLFLTLFAAVGGVWLFKEPIALKVCPMLKARVSPDECVKEIAVRLSKPELCEKIEGEGYTYENPPKSQCYTDIAARTNDPSLCAKAEGGFISQTTFSCTYKVAVENKNAAACAMLEGSESRLGMETNKDTCFKAIGKTEADAASAPPKKGPAPLVAGLSAQTLDLVAYALITLWVVWLLAMIAMKAKGAAGGGDEDEEEEPAKEGKK